MGLFGQRHTNLIIFPAEIQLVAGDDAGMIPCGGWLWAIVVRT